MRRRGAREKMEGQREGNRLGDGETQKPLTVDGAERASFAKVISYAILQLQISGANDKCRTNMMSVKTFSVGDFLCARFLHYGVIDSFDLQHREMKALSHPRGKTDCLLAVSNGEVLIGSSGKRDCLTKPPYQLANTINMN